MKNYGLIPKKIPQFHPTAHQLFGTPDITTLPTKFDIIDIVGPVDQGGTCFCFGYCIRQLCSDIDQQVYDENFGIAMVSKLMGASDVNGAPALTAMKAMIAYGPLLLTDAPAGHTWQEKGQDFIADPNNWDTSLLAKAAPHQRIGVSNVLDPKSGLDTFDNIKAQMFQHRRSIALATQWFPNFALPASTGMVGEITDREHFSWHMYECMGFDTFNGEQYIKVKPHEGMAGSQGYFYFDRQTVNLLASNELANVLIFTDTPQDLSTQIQLKTLSLLQIVVDLYTNLIGLFTKNNG